MFEPLYMSSLLLQPAGDDPVCLRHANGIVWTVFSLTCVQPFCLGCPLPSCRKTLEFTRQGLPVCLSKSLFPGSHDSPNLCYPMNRSAEVQTYIFYVLDGMQAPDCSIQPYSHLGEYPYQLPMAPEWSPPPRRCSSICQHLGCWGLRIFML